MHINVNVTRHSLSESQRLPSRAQISANTISSFTQLTRIKKHTVRSHARITFASWTSRLWIYVALCAYFRQPADTRNGMHIKQHALCKLTGGIAPEIDLQTYPNVWVWPMYYSISYRGITERLRIWVADCRTAMNSLTLHTESTHTVSNKDSNNPAYPIDNGRFIRTYSIACHIHNSEFSVLMRSATRCIIPPAEL